MRAYGGDYKSIYAGVMSDVNGLGAGIDKQLDIAQKQLDALNLIELNTNKYNVDSGFGVTWAQLQAVARGTMTLAGIGISLAKTGITGDKNLAGNLLDEFGIPHATGLNYVPFDNYPARLHKGERVLTANESKGYSSDTNGGEITVHSHIYLDGREVAQNVTKHIRRDGGLSEEIRRAVN